MVAAPKKIGNMPKKYIYTKYPNIKSKPLIVCVKDTDIDNKTFSRGRK